MATLGWYGYDLTPHYTVVNNLNGKGDTRTYQA
jgi:hypothetical protein